MASSASSRFLNVSLKASFPSFISSIVRWHTHASAIRHHILSCQVRRCAQQKLSADYKFRYRRDREIKANLPMRLEEERMDVVVDRNTHLMTDVT